MPLKMDGWNMKIPFGMAYFQGRTASFREDTLPKFNSSPLKSYRAPIGKACLPTIIFQGRAVKLREGSGTCQNIKSWLMFCLYFSLMHIHIYNIVQYSIVLDN